MKKAHKLSSQSGFTFIEVMIVAVIMAILASSIMFAAPRYFSKRRDNQRKVDLNQMKTAFEDYANDHTCYPDENLVQDCNSTTALSPYMRKVHCDPGTEQPYEYILASDCRSYEIYTTLEDASDKDITEIGCQGGCGPGNAFNYGVVGGGAILDR